jgi:altronate hydrolase
MAQATTPLIELHPNDNVLVAREQLIGGSVVGGLRIRGLVPAGHKVARMPIALGQIVRRYDQIIGIASANIDVGEHVHTHNLAMSQDVVRNYDFCADRKPNAARQTGQFMGIKRASGMVATRNYIGVLTSVNCSATVARAIADHFAKQSPSNPLRNFPNIDGVVAITHGLGCGMDDKGLGMQILQRTVRGYARHANFAAILVIGLGCEANQIANIFGDLDTPDREKFHTFTIQDLGGTRKAVAHGIAQVAEFLPTANAVRRQACDLSHLVIGLQCGGSDGYSGISANPALGNAVDRLVAHGGTAILSETPEIYGAEHLLVRRAVSPAVGQQLIDRIRWWEEHTRLHRVQMNNNPSPGNKAGGLTTILEKSLGAVAKGGTSNLNAVFEYAEPVNKKGLVFMDTPGYDPVSATGQVAGGANLICFTTGRGSAYGCAPTPSLKLATNTDLWHRQADDIDINCGEIIDGVAPLPEMGERIFQRMIATASGEITKSEEHGYGQNEFVPWQLGATL